LNFAILYFVKYKARMIRIMLFSLSFFLLVALFAQESVTKKDLPQLKGIFDSHGMKGTIIILNRVKNEMVGYNKVFWDSGYLPASTFKIPNTLIGLESKVIDTNTVFKWNGEKRRLPQWEQDLSLREAFQVSCVPCYQDVARRIGAERMKFYLQKMNYGKMDVDQSNIDLFWLEGNSRITPAQQVGFLEKLYEEKLPMSPLVMRQVKAIMLNEKTENYTLSGKTGWSIRNGNNYGWFVGYLETQGSVYIFAALIEPKDQKNTEDFASARKAICKEVFQELEIIK
jgi:beta-lactamase class D OXA-209